VVRHAHSPWRALTQDKGAFGSLDAASAEHYGELVAMDRSIGTLRRRLRELGLADNTLIVFCSDNGGLPNITPETVGGLRGFKGTVYEGGLRVPGIIEWPAVIKSPRITRYPAGARWILPDDRRRRRAAAQACRRAARRREPEAAVHARARRAHETDCVSLSGSGRVHRQPVQGRRRQSQAGKIRALRSRGRSKGVARLAAEQPAVFRAAAPAAHRLDAAVEASVAGKDYAEGKVVPADPEPVFWTETPQYQPYLAEWSKRWNTKRRSRTRQDRQEGEAE